MGKNRWDINSSFNVTAADIIKAHSPPLWGQTHGRCPASDAHTRGPELQRAGKSTAEEHSMAYRNTCSSTDSLMVWLYDIVLCCFISLWSQIQLQVLQRGVYRIFRTAWEHQILVRVRQGQLEGLRILSTHFSLSVSVCPSVWPSMWSHS